MTRLLGRAESAVTQSARLGAGLRACLSAGLSVCLWAGLLAGLSACSPTQLLVRQAADQLAAQGQDDEEDLALARDAAPFYLKLSETLLQRTPGHLALAEAVAGGFTRYAWAFVAFEADKLEAQDARAAQRLRDRASRLYARAHRHAMQALVLRHPELRQALQTGADLRLSPEAVGAAYWAAASWGGWISLSKDRPDVVADLPQAVHLARLAYQQDATHDRGGLAALMGSLEAARPGGSLAQAGAYFDQAIAAGGGPGALVAKAEGLALAQADRPAFEQLLRQALQAAPLARDLASQVMRERARWLLDTADDRF